MTWGGKTPLGLLPKMSIFVSHVMQIMHVGILRHMYIALEPNWMLNIEKETRLSTVHVSTTLPFEITWCMIIGSDSNDDHRERMLKDNVNSKIRSQIRVNDRKGFCYFRDIILSYLPFTDLNGYTIRKWYGC